jgi:molybdopterin synthase catalytic subunit
LTHHAGVHKKGEFSLTTLMESVRKSENFDKTGAIGLFIGVVRGENNEGQKVKKMTLEAYEEKADETLQQICDDLARKQGVVDVQIHHLLGEFDVGEEVVYVSVAGSHRSEVFSVLREAVERYKHETPVFKKEKVIDGQGVVHETWVSEKESNKKH